MRRSGTATRVEIAEQEDGTATVRVSGGASEMFREIIDSLKDGIDKTERSYDPDRKIWTVANLEGLREWAEEVREFFGIDIIWLGWKRPRPEELGRKQRELSRKMTVEAAFTILHLTKSAPPGLIEMAWKWLAKENHPDKGGELRVMQDVNEAFQTLKQNGIVK